jgi:hypothetical protein
MTWFQPYVKGNRSNDPPCPGAWQIASQDRGGFFGGNRHDGAMMEQFYWVFFVNPESNRYVIMSDDEIGKDGAGRWNLMDEGYDVE